jgi:dTMP kinase
VFISLEGPDGGGKTTQVHLLAEWLRSQGHDVLQTREPGGTRIGDQIRSVLHDSANTDMDPRTEILLYSASRAQLVAQLLSPALDAGKIVVCDRFFDSTLAYQGFGRGLDLRVLKTVTAFATAGLKPDLTICLDLDPGKGLQRRLLGGGEWNRLDAEALAFHESVRAGYLELAKAEPERWAVIDGARPVEVVQQEIRQIVATRMQGTRSA